MKQEATPLHIKESRSPSEQNAPGRRIRWILAPGLALVALAGLGCGSLPKAKLEEKLKELPKNASIQSLERLEFEADLGEGPETFELVYHMAPATAPGPNNSSAPVVLVHGTPSTLFTWTEVMHGRENFDGLAATRDVYAIEILGHGVAPGGGPFGFERCARFVTAAIRALGLERVHLVGSSYGGEFVWRAALNEPELIESLVLIDSSGYQRADGDWLPEEEIMRENSFAKLGWMLNSRDRIDTALAPHFDGVPPDRTEEFFLVCENSTNWKAMIDLARDENGDRAQELAQLQARTLVLWGADDIAYSLEDYGQRFANDIPRAELIALPDTGHYPHEQDPETVVPILIRFFDSESGQTGDQG